MIYNLIIILFIVLSIVLIIYRKINSLYDNNNITIHLFSYNENKLNLQPLIEHFLDNCDKMVIYLNEYTEKPILPKNNKIKLINTKFRDDYSEYKSYEGYQLFINDKYVFPKYYVQNIVNNIDKYNKQYVVGYDGKLFTKEAETIDDIFVHYNIDQYLDKDREVHNLEYGILGFHSKSFRLSASDIRFQNMVSFWIAIQGQLQKTPFICLKHSKDYILKMDYGKNMYEETALHKITETNKECISKSILKDLNFKILGVLPV